jgi:hypothetical protein
MMVAGNCFGSATSAGNCHSSRVTGNQGGRSVQPPARGRCRMSYRQLMDPERDPRAYVRISAQLTRRIRSGEFPGDQAAHHR